MNALSTQGRCAFHLKDDARSISRTMPSDCLSPILGEGDCNSRGNQQGRLDI
jgi:hypothetical protein